MNRPVPYFRGCVLRGTVITVVATRVRPGVTILIGKDMGQSHFLLGQRGVSVREGQHAPVTESSLSLKVHLHGRAILKIARFPWWSDAHVFAPFCIFIPAEISFSCDKMRVCSFCSHQIRLGRENAHFVAWKTNLSWHENTKRANTWASDHHGKRAIFKIARPCKCTFITPLRPRRKWL